MCCAWGRKADKGQTHGWGDWMTLSRLRFCPTHLMHDEKEIIQAVPQIWLLIMHIPFFRCLAWVDDAMNRAESFPTSYIYHVKNLTQWARAISGTFLSSLCRCTAQFPAPAWARPKSYSLIPPARAPSSDTLSSAAISQLSSPQCLSEVGVPTPHQPPTPNYTWLGLLHQICPETEGLIHHQDAADFWQDNFSGNLCTKCGNAVVNFSSSLS